MPGHESFDRDFDDEEDDRAQTDWKLKNPTSSQEARNWEAKRLREQLVGDKRLAELRTEREGRERSDVLFLQVGLNVYDVMQLVCYRRWMRLLLRRERRLPRKRTTTHSRRTLCSCKWTPLSRFISKLLFCL